MPEIETQQTALPLQIAAEVAKILAGAGLPVNHRPIEEPWVNLPEAARMLGYSSSRLYHIYDRLGLVPSRTSKRKLRFRRQEVEHLLILSRNRGAGRPRKTRATMSVASHDGTKPGLHP